VLERVAPNKMVDRETLPLKPAAMPCSKPDRVPARMPMTTPSSPPQPASLPRSENCAMNNLGAEPGTKDCIKKDTGLSDGCVDCFDGAVVCSKKLLHDPMPHRFGR